MKDFNPIAIIKKYQFLIIGLSLIAGVIFYFIFNNNQTYTATAIIEYTNSAASQGLAPDGSSIDTSEIYSAKVMKEVFSRMGLSYDEYNLDEFRSKVVVEPILSEEEKAVQEAKNDKGEEVETEPTKYMVSFTLDHSAAPEPEAFARQVLDNMLDIFLRVYAEEHIGTGSVVNDIPNLEESSYDYIEAIEVIETNVENTLLKLSKNAQNNWEFRSFVSGYSFNDLYRELSLIAGNDIPNIYAYILNNKISKDENILIAKYQKRIKDYNIDNESIKREIADIKEIIDVYVKMMRESGNTDITYEYILDQVHDSYYQEITGSGEESQTSWMKPDERVEYDVLLENYVENRTAYEYTLIEIAYCEYIIETFGGSVKASSNGTVQLETPQYTAGSGSSDASVVEIMLEETLEKLDAFYEKLSAVNVEFSEYAGAANVGLISNIVVKANLQILLYSLIVVVAFAVLLSIVVLLIGRMSDILNYYVYIDRKLMIPNRSACDRYLNKHQQVLLKRNFVCISINIQGLREKNKLYGRDECDNMMRKLVEIMERIFPAEPECFLALNGLGQFVVFLDGISEAQANAYMKYIGDEAREHNSVTKCPIDYYYGIAEAEKEDIYQVRNLMICAINKANATGTEKVKTVKEMVAEEVAAATEMYRAEKRETAKTAETAETVYQREEELDSRNRELEDLLKRLERMQ